MRRSAALLAGSLALLPTAAGAEQPWERSYTIDEIAADLAYGLCPLYLAGQLPLTGNAMLTERGLSDKVSRQASPRFGEMEQVEGIRPDGKVAFGGVPGKVCSVTVTDAQLDLISARLHRDMNLMGIPFKPEPLRVQNGGKTKVEVFKGPLDGKMLYVQLIRMQAPKPAIVVQLFGMAN